MTDHLLRRTSSRRRSTAGPFRYFRHRDTGPSLPFQRIGMLAWVTSTPGRRSPDRMVGRRLATSCYYSKQLAHLPTLRHGARACARRVRHSRNWPKGIYWPRWRRLTPDGQIPTHQIERETAQIAGASRLPVHSDSQVSTQGAVDRRCASSDLRGRMRSAFAGWTRPRTAPAPGVT